MGMTAADCCRLTLKQHAYSIVKKYKLNPAELSQRKNVKLMHKLAQYNENNIQDLTVNENRRTSRDQRKQTPGSEHEMIFYITTIS
jgi:hypothetical protein